MRLIRIHTPGPLVAPGPASLTGTGAVHVRRVLRLRAGDAVTLFNGDGWDYPATLVALEQDRVAFEVTARVAARPESPLALTLVQGVARGERMDLVVQKATELGVARIVPVLCERSVVRVTASQAARKQAHWQAIAVAACEQCGRARLPAVVPPLPFGEWLDQPSSAALRVMLSPDAPLSLARSRAASAELLVGPEGGLAPGEVDSARRAGFEARALGPRILRTETAAIVALAVLQAAAGDLG